MTTLPCRTLFFLGLISAGHYSLSLCTALMFYTKDTLSCCISWIFTICRKKNKRDHVSRNEECPTVERTIYQACSHVHTGARRLCAGASHPITETMAASLESQEGHRRWCVGFGRGGSSSVLSETQSEIACRSADAPVLATLLAR